jgi:hypothetical protein
MVPEELENHLAQAQQGTNLDECDIPVSEFGDLDDYNGQLPGWSLPLTGNTVREEPYVDCGTTCCLNASQPLIGLADLSAKLAADGTLSESAAKTDDTAAEKLLGVLPVSDVVESSSFREPVDVAEAAKAAKILAAAGVDFQLAQLKSGFWAPW